MSARFQLLDSEEYVQDATKAISLARNRISLLTMIMCYDESTADFFDAIAAAKARGVTVTTSLDTFTYAELGGHFRFHSQFSKKINAIALLKKKFRAAGIKLNWLGSYAPILISGRTHGKWLVVDDTVYTFGGVNLYEFGIHSTDYMFKVTDKSLADRLVDEHARILSSSKNGRLYGSHSFGDDTSQVLIDGGIIGDSIIYRRVCKLATEAAHITYVSQYCPTGKIGHLLKKNDTKLYFNPWNQANSLNSLFIRVESKLTGLRTSYTRSGYIHGKFIIYTMPDGSKIAITGSHNFAQGGVWLGTREIALETRDPHVIKQLEQFVKNYIA